ncbi:MAG: SgcJ/EcaC family oxidoreductase [Usitatibacter sp.]
MTAVLAACAMPGESRNEGARQREVADATAAWVAAYNSRDPSRITALYDREAILWGTSSGTIRTDPAAIAEYFKNAGRRPEARVSVIDQHVRVFGDVALNTGAYTFTDVQDGRAVSRPARFTFVYRNRDGRWLIADHHSSRVPTS